MAKKKSKSDIIAAYVAKHPKATWRTAAQDLEKRGITSGYFASQRSKLKTQGTLAVVAEDASGETTSGASSEARPHKKRGPKPGRKPGRKPATIRIGGSSTLTDAVEFARKAGGLQQAQALLEELARVQV